MQELAKILSRRENMIASLLVDTGFKKIMQRFAPTSISGGSMLRMKNVKNKILKSLH